MVPAAAAAPGKGDPLAGMAVAAPCAGCHGIDGNSTDPKNPRLAGLGADYLIAAINGYKDGTRKHDVMRDRVLALRDQDVRDLAAYYASKEPQALPIRKPLTLAEWTARCGRCHGAGVTAPIRASRCSPDRTRAIWPRPSSNITWGHATTN